MGTVDRERLCPVCGFELGFGAWDSESPSDEICPCCGIQFGYDDAAGGDAARRGEVYAKWRADWIAAGMPWIGRGRSAPTDWNPGVQIKRTGLVER